jgi:hypothetical protein
MNPGTIEKDAALTDELTQINKDMAKAADAALAVLEERIFVNIFLPLFTGEKSVSYGADFDTWVNYAGGPYREVKIIDAAGTVLFNVPPLFDREAIESLSGNGIPFSHIIHTSIQYSRIHPSQGKQYLDTMLADSLKDLKGKKSHIPNLEAWNAIFLRYGLPPIVAAQATVTAAVADDTDFEYEPL